MQLLDDQGLSVKDSLAVDSVVVDTVAKIQAGSTYTVRSVSNGMTPVILRAGLVAQTVQVVVNQKVASVKLSASHTTFDALGDTVHLAAAVSDSMGAPLANQVLSYSANDTSVATASAAGVVTSKGNGTTWVRSRAYNGVADSVAVVVAQQVARVVAKRDSVLLDALQAVLPVQATPVDRLGASVTAAALTYATGSPSIATIDATGDIRAIANGTTLVTATYGSDTAKVAVRVTQRPVRVLVPSDTVRFVALGETQAIQGIAVDSLGYAVSSAVQGLRVTDTTVMRQVDSITVQSRANGTTVETFTVSGISAKVTIVVAQVAVRVTASIVFSQPILALAGGTAVPLNCASYDRNGSAIPTPPTVTSIAGTVSSGPCGQSVVRASGLDTLRVQAGNVVANVPVSVAVAPVADGPMGQPIVVDSFLPNSYRWTPSVRRNSAGLIELYLTQYPYGTSQYPRGNLYRFVSADGLNFHNDGVVLSYAPDSCAPDGSGIENVAVAPRSDGPGWRMFYAGGSWGCYGWQVFSAVSTDERNWVKEDGVRLSNGGELFTPPSPPSGVPWPVGEGMTIDRLTDGRWRIITASFDHVLNPAPDDHWQISEWLSGDQVNWTYSSIILRASQMPPEGQGSVYSPSIVQLAPGLFRMFFTADNRHVSSPRHSTLWTAVSTDKQTWQVEGELLGVSGVDLYYATIIDGRLYFLSNVSGAAWAPVPRVATIQMP